VQEINRALAQLEEVTQQNATMVQQAAAKSAAYQEEADRLMGIVERFKIGTDTDELFKRRTPASAAKVPAHARLPRRPAADGPREEWTQF
jgi:methyl-accepting chemotaxis protein